MGRRDWLCALVLLTLAFSGGCVTRLPNPGHDVVDGLQFMLPDLVIDQIYWEASGSEVFPVIRVKNGGNASADPFNVTAYTITSQSGDPGGRCTGTYSGRSSSSTGVGNTATVHLNRDPMTQPLDPSTFPPDCTAKICLIVTVTAVADPATSARPGGEIWESNETNNQLTRSFQCNSQTYCEVKGGYPPPCIR